MVHDLRALRRLAEGRAAQPTAAIFDSRTVQSTPESGGRAGYDGHKSVLQNRCTWQDWLDSFPEVIRDTRGVHDGEASDHLAEFCNTL